MKFKSFSGEEIPAWALAILHSLGTVPPHPFKQLVELVADETLPDEDYMPFLRDTCLYSRDDAAKSAAVINWVKWSALRSHCIGAELVHDLMVLGLPKPHAVVFAEAVDIVREEQTEENRTGPLMNYLYEHSVGPGPEFTTDCYLLMIETAAVYPDDGKKEFLLPKTQADILIEELEKAYNKMEEAERTGVLEQ